MFDREAELLATGGFDVRRLVVSNDEIVSTGDKIRTLVYSARSPRGVRAMVDALNRHQPDVVHVHNVFPLLTPAIFGVCRKLGYPVVHTLHNYRTVCANALLQRDGKVCEDCLDVGFVPAVVHRCYRGSLAGSAAVAWSIQYHRSRGTWRRDVDRFVALTDFASQIFVRSGIPEKRIVVKPNFAPDPGRPPNTTPRCGFLFVGRLSPEKGGSTLVDAFRGEAAELTIVGDGPDRQRLEEASSSNITFTGHLNEAAVAEKMSQACALIVPSMWYEGFPLVVAEALAHGLPIIASRIGGLSEVVANSAGYLFTPGSASELKACVSQLHKRSELVRCLSRKARAAYESAYSPAVNLRQLTRIYYEVVTARPRV